MPFADADKRREYDADDKRKARVAEPCPTRLSVPVEFRAKTAADVLGLLNEQLDTLRQDASLGSVERAKAVGYLAGIMLRAIEAGDVAARLEALEAILKSRPKEGTRLQAQIDLGTTHAYPLPEFQRHEHDPSPFSASGWAACQLRESSW